MLVSRFLISRNFAQIFPTGKGFMNLETIPFQNQPSKNVVFLFYVRLSKVTFMKIHSIVIATQCEHLAIFSFIQILREIKL